MRDVVIASAVRTPIGRGHPTKGMFRDIHPNDLLGTVYQAALERATSEPGDVDFVIAGCVGQIGAQGANIARNAWLQAGLPVETPALTVDFQCGSSQQAISQAIALIASGAADIVLAAGVEHMGRVPLDAALDDKTLGEPWPQPLLERHALVPQGISAELLVDKWDISRSELDELALLSHQRAAAATAEGRFAAEIVPVQTADAVCTTDQGIRTDTSIDLLSALAPAFRPNGSITAGNASQISDGAAAVVLMSEEVWRQRSDAAPLASVRDHVAVGVDPVLMLTGPIAATAQVLARNRLRMADIDRVEVNEAFASVVLAWQRECDADLDRVNVNGGAIALGHPLGCSGARLVTTVVHELERSDAELGLVTMCCRGGLGTGLLLARDDR
jgi:acetyl-CoA acyltransferase